MKKAMVAFLCGAGVVALVVAAEAAAAKKKKVSRPKYSNARHGFSIETPLFADVPKGKSLTLAAFKAPVSKASSSNVNILIQKRSTSIDAYDKLTLKELNAMGVTINSKKRSKVGGLDALHLDCEGKMVGRELRFLSLAVFKKDEVVLVTCTALKSEFKGVEKEFRACLASFKLTP